jgi:hypothetical protein
VGCKARAHLEADRSSSIRVLQCVCVWACGGSGRGSSCALLGLCNNATAPG